MKLRRPIAILSSSMLCLAAIAISAAGCSGSKVQVGVGRPIPPAEDEDARGGGLTVRGSHNTGAAATGRQSGGSPQPTIRTGRGGAGRPR